ncbi:hypothetical protein [Chitinophaga sp. MD30]|nr:hypothetical protein [Chitinophaga sp. MD30]
MEAFLLAGGASFLWGVNTVREVFFVCFDQENLRLYAALLVGNK